MRHSLLSPELMLGVYTGAYAEVPFSQPRFPGPYGRNLAQITMTQYALGATLPFGALIMKQLLLALAALFALFVVPAFADVPYVQGCSKATTGWLTGNTTLTQYNSGTGPLGLATPNGAPYCVITNTSNVQTGWPGASMWFGDLPASNNDWVQSNGTGGPLPGYTGQFTQIVWAYVFVTGPNAWHAQPNQSTAAFIIDNNPNIQNAVNGVYGPNNGAPSYFESLFALSVPPGGGSVQVFYTTDYFYTPNPGLPLVATITQNGWYGFAATYSRDPTGTGTAILTQQVMDANGNVLGSNTQSNANTPSQSLFGTDEQTLNWQPGQTGFMGNAFAIIGSQSYLGTPVPLAPPATSGSGSITGVLTIPAAGSNISLTAKGTTDWAAWGYNGSTSLTPVDRKTTGGSKISALTAMGSANNRSFNNSTFSLSWSDGLPTASSVNDQNGIYASGINNGYSFTVPASTTPQTVYVQVGLYQTSAGKLTATLSDGSAPAYVDTSLGDTVDTSHGKEAYYSITYKAGSPGQSLTVTWSNTTSSGNVTIQGIALGTTSALGSIVGALTIPAGSNVNLTAQGTTDWAVWGYGGSPNFTPVFRKSSGGSKISAITAIGNGGYYDFGNSTFALSWTDGSPTTSVSSDANGIYVPGVNNGYSITVPATTSPQVVYVYLGLYQTTAGKLTATLSDGSAAPYVNTSLGDTVDTTHGQEARYAITYNAASAGQTLKISWVNTTGNGNVTMQGVALAP